MTYEDKLIDALFSARPDVAETCAWVLGERRSCAAVEALCAVVRCRTDLDDVRVAAIGALAKIGDERAEPALAAAARTGTLVVRLAAVEALAAFDLGHVRQVLEQSARHDLSRLVRAAARGALGIAN